MAVMMAWRLGELFVRRKSFVTADPIASDRVADFSEYSTDSLHVNGPDQGRIFKNLAAEDVIFVWDVEGDGDGWRLHVNGTGQQ